MEKVIEAAVSARQLLTFYAPYNFIRELSAEKQFEHSVLHKIEMFADNDNNKIITIEIEGEPFYFLLSYLPWDTDFFKIPTYKLLHVLSENKEIRLLGAACKAFIQQVQAGSWYCFIEIPSEDIMLIQALNEAGFCLIETRLTYYRGNLEAFTEPRYPVRKAGVDDTDVLTRTAAVMRNDYDRFHADHVFDAAIADSFLSKYIEQSLKGFADVVLMPDEPGMPGSSFLTANYLKSDWEKNGLAIAKMVLSAVAVENRGWYKKLVSEMTYLLKQEGAAYIFMNTQSTNRAVFHTWESLGYKLGCTTHILRYTNK